MTDYLQQDIPWLGTASNEELQRAVEALYHVHELTAVLPDLDTLLLRLGEESQRVARAEASALMLFDPETEELYFHTALGESGDQEALKREIRLKLGQGIAGAAAQTRKLVNVSNAQDDSRFYRGADAKSNFTTRNLLAVPMVEHDNLIGVLEVVNKIGGGAFTALDSRVMEMFSSRAATAVANARLIQERVNNERLAAVGQAVAGLSHYTKNIITGLSGSIELIEMGLDNDNTEVLRRAFPIFKRSSKRISHFVEDMLSFSKRREPMRESCRISDLVQETLDTFNDLVQRRNAKIEIDIENASGVIYVDSQGIYRCLLNLLGNAAHAVPEEGGRILIGARALPAGNLEIEVTDNGPGVPEAHRQKIFDPFFSTKGSGGTGLGLAVTAKIVKEHGGVIRVEDAPGGGARFLIVLPEAADNEKESLGA